MDRHANGANSGSSLLQCFYCTPQVEDVQDSKSRDKDQAREARIDLVVHCGHEQGSEVHMYQAPRGRLPDGSLKGQRPQGTIPAQEDLRICRRQYLDSTSPPACTACAKRENIHSFTPPPPSLPGDLDLGHLLVHAGIQSCLVGVLSMADATLQRGRVFTHTA